MWYKDLTECDYFGKEYAGIFTAIGWLKNGKDFPKGSIPRDVYKKIWELSRIPWAFISFRGFHQCDLCEFQFEYEGEKGIKNIFIPYKEKIYVFPELITHYINAHFYCPPREFIEAVFLCPSINSVEYKEKLLENGGNQLAEFIK